MAETETATPGQTQAIGDDGTASWAAAAQPSTPAAQPTQPQPAAQPGAAPPPQGGQPAPSPQQALEAAKNPDRSAVNPESPQVQTQLQYIPMPMRPVNTGLRGVIDKIADVLAGTTRPELYENEQGEKFVYHPQMTRGQQWQRIGAELISGAAHGLAVGQGPGGAQRAAAAGIQNGFNMHQQEQEAERQMGADAERNHLVMANAQMMRMKLAEESWNLSRLQPDADEATAKTSIAQGQKYLEQHGQMVGTMAHPGDLADVMHSTPDLAEQMVKKGTINLVPHYQQGENGTWHLNGIEVWKMPEGWRTEVLPPKTSFDWFNPQTGQIEQQVSSDPITAGEQSDYHTQAAQAQLKWKADQAEQKLKAAQAGNADSEANARNQKLPSEISEAQARANEANARATNLRQMGTAANADGTPNAGFENLAQALYDGDLTAQDLKREAKGAGLDPNKIMGRAVEIGQQPGAKYGPWSESLIKTELHFATDNKVTAAIDGIDRLLGTNGMGPLDQVIQTAQEAHIGNHGAFNAANLSVRRFFGDTAAKNLETAVTEARRSVAGLIGNPLLGGGETDKKLEQAKDLLGKSPTLENLQGANTLIKTALGTQRASLISKNRFLQRKYGNGAQAQPGQAQPGQPVKMIPGEPQAKLPDGTIQVVRDGKWVTAQQ